MKRFRATVNMKKPWSTEYIRKPSIDMVLEALADEILSGRIDAYFEVIIERVTERMNGCEKWRKRAKKHEKRLT